MSNIFYRLKEQPQEDKTVTGNGGNIFHKMIGSREEKTPLAKNLLGAGAGVAALGGAGVGAYKLGKGVKDFWQLPNKQISPIDTELSNIAKQTQIAPGVREQDVPGLLRTKISDLRTEIKDFDDLMLSTSAEDLASSVKSAYPKLRETNFKAYGTALETGEDLITKSGKQLSPMSFNDDVITQTVKELKNTLPDDVVGKLKPMAVKGADETITLSQAKQYLTELKGDLPAEGQRIIDRKWGGFLEKNAPGEVKDVLKTANAKYSTFIEQDKALRKLIDPKTGDYDYDKLYRYTFQRSKTRINSDFKNLMSGLSEIEPEVGTKAGNLYSLRAKRISLQRNINNLKTNIAKAEELVSKKQAILEKYPVRTKGAGKLIGGIGKNVAKGLLFKGLGAFSTGLLDQSFQNTEKDMGGNPLEVIQQILRPSMINKKGSWRKQLSSDEEFKRWQLENAI